MTMTLEQVRDALREYQSTGHVFNVKSLADAIDFHLSQPQPVAQGEAVACAEVVIDPSTGNRQLVTYFANGVTPDVGTKLYTIPTGHRLVPVNANAGDLFWDHEDREYGFCSVDELVDGWYQDSREDGLVVKVARAMNLPDIWVKFTDKGDGEYSHEVFENDPNAAPTGGG